MRNIYVERPHTPQEVLEVVTDRLPVMMSQHDIGLIGCPTSKTSTFEHPSSSLPRLASERVERGAQTLNP